MAQGDPQVPNIPDLTVRVAGGAAIPTPNTYVGMARNPLASSFQAFSSTLAQKGRFQAQMARDPKKIQEDMLRGEAARTKAGRPLLEAIKRGEIHATESPAFYEGVMVTDAMEHSAKDFNTFQAEWNEKVQTKHSDTFDPQGYRKAYETYRENVTQFENPHWVTTYFPRLDSQFNRQAVQQEGDARGRLLTRDVNKGVNFIVNNVSTYAQATDPAEQQAILNNIHGVLKRHHEMGAIDAEYNVKLAEQILNAGMSDPKGPAKAIELLKKIRGGEFSKIKAVENYLRDQGPAILEKQKAIDTENAVKPDQNVTQSNNAMDHVVTAFTNLTPLTPGDPDSVLNYAQAKGQLENLARKAYEENEKIPAGLKAHGDNLNQIRDKFRTARLALDHAEQKLQATATLTAALQTNAAQIQPATQSLVTASGALGGAATTTFTNFVNAHNAFIAQLKTIHNPGDSLDFSKHKPYTESEAKKIAADVLYRVGFEDNAGNPEQQAATMSQLARLQGANPNLSQFFNNRLNELTTMSENGGDISNRQEDINLLMTLAYEFDKQGILDHLVDSSTGRNGQLVAELLKGNPSSGYEAFGKAMRLVQTGFLKSADVKVPKAANEVIVEHANELSAGSRRQFVQYFRGSLPFETQGDKATDDIDDLYMESDSVLILGGQTLGIQTDQWTDGDQGLMRAISKNVTEIIHTPQKALARELFANDPDLMTDLKIKLGHFNTDVLDSMRLTWNNYAQGTTAAQKKELVRSIKLLTEKRTGGELLGIGTTAAATLGGGDVEELNLDYYLKNHMDDVLDLVVNTGYAKQAVVTNPDLQELYDHSLMYGTGGQVRSGDITFMAVHGQRGELTMLPMVTYDEDEGPVPLIAPGIPLSFDKPTLSAYSDRLFAQQQSEKLTNRVPTGFKQAVLEKASELAGGALDLGLSGLELLFETISPVTGTETVIR